jgi:hypothetical protein
MSEEELNKLEQNGMRRLEVSKEEMDYLSHRFEIRDHIELFTWAIKMLYDIAQLDEDGWRLSFQKCDINMEKKEVKYHNYAPIHYGSLEALSPTNQGYRRLPTPEMINKTQKLNEPTT